MHFLRLSEARFLRRRRASPLASLVPEPSLEPFTAEQVAFAARAWTMKAEEEHHSAATFADLLSLFVDVTHVPLDLSGTIARVVADELRHTELCLELARRYGASPPRARPLDRRSVPVDPRGRWLHGLSIVLVEGAMGETVSSALFLAGFKGSTEPCTKAALGLILRDEVLHARGFWEALELLRGDLDDEAREALHVEVSRALAAVEKGRVLPALRRLERGEPFDPAWAALGVLPPEVRVEAFYEAVERRVCPRLDRLGLDGARAWTNRYRVVGRGVRDAVSASR